jgi:hypothetical protein
VLVQHNHMMLVQDLVVVHILIHMTSMFELYMQFLMLKFGQIHILLLLQLNNHVVLVLQVL